ncbi:MAG TPA: hypothetical protein VL362_00585, partial [Patescibacteria group bacterium]|nr:hypothetical protein [Patescibacteria group bacterium]
MRVARYIASTYGRARWVTRIFVSIIVLALSSAPAFANTPLSEGYVAKDSVAVGSLVSLLPDSSDTVKAATVEAANNLLGVVVSGQNSSIALGR